MNILRQMFILECTILNWASIYLRLRWFIWKYIICKCASWGNWNLLNRWSKMMWSLMNISSLWNLLKHSVLLSIFNLLGKNILLLLNITIRIIWLLGTQVRTLVMLHLLLLDRCRYNSSAAADSWVWWWRSVYLVCIALSY